MSMISRIVALLFITTCTAVPSGAGNDQKAADTAANAATEWATRQYGSVAEHVLGSATSADGLELGTAWVVTFRVRSAYDAEPELQVSLRKLHSGEVTAKVRKLRGPLQRQLEEIYREHKGSTPSEIAKSIQVDDVALTHGQCSALKKIATSFERIRTPIAIKNELVLDPRQYQVWIDAGSQQEYFSLLGASHRQSKHPIIVWIEESMKRIQEATRRCGPPA